MDENLEYDLWRQSYMTLVKSTQAQIGIPIEIRTVAGDQPADAVWVEFILLTGKGGRKEMGGGKRGLQMQTATVQFMVFGPENQGDGDLMRIGNRIKRIWDELDTPVPPVGWWKTECLRVQTLGARQLKKGFVSVVVDGPMCFTFRRGDALLTS